MRKIAGVESILTAVEKWRTGTRKLILGMLPLLLPTATVSAEPCGISRKAEPKPNFIIILADDLGYGDLGCYGADRIKTPHIDRMAAEGMKFTDFYATAPICTPTRASLMTGSYPSRIGLGTPLHTPDTIGLHEDEITIAELLKSRGYATACRPPLTPACPP